MRSGPVRTLGHLATLLLLWGGVAACGTPTEPSTTAAPTDTAAEEVEDPSEWTFEDLDSYEPLAPDRLLRRLSFDLRGVPPTLDELTAVQADPEALSELRAEFLDDPRWRARLADLLAEQLLTRVDTFNATIQTVGYDESEEYSFERAVGNEPVLFLAVVGTEDRPWTDAATADWTVANEVLFDLFPLEPVDAAELGIEGTLPEGWEPARYTDGRPAGGVLMTTGLWWRYWSAPNNYNRTRAAALSRLFLCADFLDRPISFEATSLLDSSSLSEATQTEEACVGCHVSLDPLGASLFGFWWFDIYSMAEMDHYHTEREWLGSYYLDMEPAWFGTPMDGPADLGPMLAQDPRFLSCTVERVSQGLLRRSMGTEDHARQADLLDTFQDSELRLQALVEAVLDTPEYQAGSLRDGATESQAARAATGRVLTPDQLADGVEELTGFRWQHEGFDQMLNDDSGYRILAGGLDGIAVARAQEDPSVSRLLVIRSLAEAASTHAARSDFELDPLSRRLLGGVDIGDRPGSEAFGAQLELLHLIFHSKEADRDQLAEEEALWTAVYELSVDQLGATEADAATDAWATVLSVLIRDPAFWTL